MSSTILEQCRRWAYLVALILGSKGVPKAQPGRGKAGVHGSGLPKVLPRTVVAADGLVVAPHRKPGHHMLWVLLHQPAECRRAKVACMPPVSKSCFSWLRHSLRKFMQQHSGLPAVMQETTQILLP